MAEKQKKIVRLVMSLELYEKIKTQATEEFRTVPKEIVQILKKEMGLLGRP